MGRVFQINLKAFKNQKSSNKNVGSWKAKGKHWYRYCLRLTANWGTQSLYSRYMRLSYYKSVEVYEMPNMEKKSLSPRCWLSSWYNDFRCQWFDGKNSTEMSKILDIMISFEVTFGQKILGIRRRHLVGKIWLSIWCHRGLPAFCIIRWGHCS